MRFFSLCNSWCYQKKKSDMVKLSQEIFLFIHCRRDFTEKKRKKGFFYFNQNVLHRQYLSIAFKRKKHMTFSISWSLFLSQSILLTFLNRQCRRTTKIYDEDFDLIVEKKVSKKFVCL